MEFYYELLGAIEYEKKLSHQYLDELSRLKPDIHNIEDIVKADKNYTMHTYCYNQLMLLKAQNPDFNTENKIINSSIYSINSILRQVINIIQLVIYWEKQDLLLNENTNLENIDLLLNENTNLENINLSSLQYSKIKNKIEEYYGIHIENDEATSWITIMDIVNTIIKNI
jgi:acyl carrier protein